MKTHRMLVPVLLAVVCASAHAQDVTLRGKVEDDPVIEGRYLVDCTGTELTGAGLDAFVGQQVELTGAWNGSTTAPSVDVTSIAAVAETFEVGGGGKIGDDLSFKVTSAPGDFAVMFAALDFGFLRARKTGVLFLSPDTLMHVANGTVRADGELEVKGTIPDDPALEGVVVYGQAFVAFAAGGKALTNPDCVTLHR